MDDQSPTGASYPKYPAGATVEAAVRREEGPPSRTKATWALVLGVIPSPLTWAFSIGLGVGVLRRSKYGVDHGRALVIGGFVAIALWIALFIMVAVIRSAGAADRGVSGDVTVGGDIPITEVRAGDCLKNDIAEDVEMLTVEVTPCTETHALESYATFTIADGDWPGQDQVDRLAEGGCVKRFEAFVGRSYGDSDIELVYLRPFEDAWAVDRGVSCLLSTGAPRTGSLKDSERYDGV